jgi:hypothetical protein
MARLRGYEELKDEDMRLGGYEERKLKNGFYDHNFTTSYLPNF